MLITRVKIYLYQWRLNWPSFGIFRIIMNNCLDQFLPSKMILISPRHQVCSASKCMSSRSRILWLNAPMVLYQLVFYVGFCVAAWRQESSELSSYGSSIDGEFSVLLVDVSTVPVFLTHKLMLLAAVVCVKQSSLDVPNHWTSTPYPTHQGW